MNTELLEELWRSWAERGAEFTAAQWATPTRLPGWSVRALFAHVAPDATVLKAMREAPVPDGHTVTSGAEILRIFNSPGEIAQTAADEIEEAARKAAETMDIDELLRRFDTDGLAELDAVRPGDVLAHPILGRVTYRAFAEVAVVDVTVHLLDLIAAVGGSPVPEPALRLTREILAAVPDPVEFIEAATGRSKVAVLPVMR
ncbi:maleylpyruvate isomerase N-terminal domain-containing protein [Nocardia sp. CA-129566]|uniref:maleylpyruvate isomerase N-terminal domain-containing protein n=1 Tax=Nocardia sp. CA-129566 TaxID=3239976 RepID=UPI003D954543